MPDAFLTATGGVFPGPPISNEEIEDVLGRIGGEASRLKRRILRNNGIRTRHFAIDRETGAPTHTTAGLAADAVRVALARRGLGIADVELLACATSVPDQVVPGHASQVHGELGGGAMEIVTTHGVCTSGMSALKYAALAVGAGGTRLAIACAAERTSSFLRATHFDSELRARAAADEEDPHIGFDQEFLRWMLSDGAGAVVVEGAPDPGRLSLKVEWIEVLSFAHKLPTCMYMGGEPAEGGGLRGWRDLGPADDAVRRGRMNLHQDVKLLGKHIVPMSITWTLAEVRRRHAIESADVDWVLPHYSSEFFREPSFEELNRAGFPIPYAKWCSNLVERGNTGSASIFLMLDDFIVSERVKAGDGVLLIVPESGRFSCAWAFLRAVAA